MSIKFNRSQTFATNGVVTAAGLHNLVDGLDIYQALITDQTSLAAVAPEDSILIADASLTAGDAPRQTTVQNLFEDALSSGTYVSLNLSGALTYGTATGNRTVSTSATITTGTIATLNSTTGTIGNLSTTLAGDLTISQGTATLGTSGVTASSYGTTSDIPRITVDAKGRITSATTVTAPVGFRNRIINGDMRIDQRNAGASVTPTDLSYTLDRWKCRLSQASKYTVQRNAGSITPPSGFTNYLGVTVGASANVTVGTSDYFAVQQIIEGFNSSDLAWGSSSASSITLSFWVRSSVTGSFGGALQNSAENRGYGFTYSISSANTWEKKTITISGDTGGTWVTDNGIGIYVNFNLGAGSQYGNASNGSWAASGTVFTPTSQTSVISTNSATWYITGVQLEAGSTATDFERRPYGTELALCQRYYEETNKTRSVEFQIQGTTNGLATTRFLQRKRTSPTVTVYSSVSNVAGTVNNGNGNVQTSISSVLAYPDCFSVQMAGTTSQVYTYYWEASSEL